MTMVPMMKMSNVYRFIGSDVEIYMRIAGRTKMMKKILGKKNKEDDLTDEVWVNTENPVLGKGGKPQNKKIKIDK